MEIGNAIYEMDWVDLSPTIRKALITMMIRASFPIKLTVARIIPMNIKSLLSVCYLKLYFRVIACLLVSQLIFVFFFRL